MMRGSVVSSDEDEALQALRKLRAQNIEDLRYNRLRFTREFAADGVPRPVFKVEAGTVSWTDGYEGWDIDAETDDARYITEQLPWILKLFLEKNIKYAKVEQGYDLGAAGIIPDLNRKLGILVARIWDGAPEVGEPTDEVIMDMIGHLLLMLAKRNNNINIMTKEEADGGC